MNLTTSSHEVNNNDECEEQVHNHRQQNTYTDSTLNDIKSQQRKKTRTQKTTSE